MSYTPPAGDAINFTWVGESAYTPPAGDEINFTWVEGGGQPGQPKAPPLRGPASRVLPLTGPPLRGPALRGD